MAGPSDPRWLLFRGGSLADAIGASRSRGQGGAGGQNAGTGPQPFLTSPGFGSLRARAGSVPAAFAPVPGNAVPAFRSATTNTVNGTGSIGATDPGTAGDFLLAFMCADTTGPPKVWTPPDGTWTLVSNSFMKAVDGCSFAIFKKLSSAGSAGTLTFSAAALEGANDQVLIICAWKNVADVDTIGAWNLADTAVASPFSMTGNSIGVKSANSTLVWVGVPDCAGASYSSMGVADKPGYPVGSTGTFAGTVTSANAWTAPTGFTLRGNTISGASSSTAARAGLLISLRPSSVTPSVLQLAGPEDFQLLPGALAFAATLLGAAGISEEIAGALIASLAGGGGTTLSLSAGQAPDEADGAVLLSGALALTAGQTAELGGAAALLAALVGAGAISAEAGGAAGLAATLVMTPRDDAGAAGAETLAATLVMPPRDAVGDGGAETLTANLNMPPRDAAGDPGAAAIAGLLGLTGVVTAGEGGAEVLAAALATAGGTSEQAAGAALVAASLALGAGLPAELAGAAALAATVIVTGQDANGLAGALALLGSLLQPGGVPGEVAGALQLALGLFTLVITGGASAEAQGAPVLSALASPAGGTTHSTAGAMATLATLLGAGGISAEQGGALQQVLGFLSVILAGADASGAPGSPSLVALLNGLSAGDSRHAAGASLLLTQIGTGAGGISAELPGRVLRLILLLLYGVDDGGKAGALAIEALARFAATGRLGDSRAHARLVNDGKTRVSVLGDSRTYARLASSGMTKAVMSGSRTEVE